MRVGEVVRVTGERGQVWAMVDHVATLDDLPELPGLDTPEVRGVLVEAGVDLLVWLRYEYQYRSGVVGPVTFVALRTQDLRWVDLRGQLLTVEREREQPEQAALFEYSPRPD